MLSPDVRAVAMDLLRPPERHRLDLAVLTTYTLDLEALLALPLAVLSQSDSSIDELMADPLRLIAALREAGNRVHVFVDETGIAIPGRGRELVSTLESSVHPVRAPNGGVFHPKIWLARFVPEEPEEDAPDLLRLAILSRNLTFDRSWDIALASEAPIGGRRVADSRSLGELLATLPTMALAAGARLPKEVSDAVAELAEQARRTEYPPPDGFDSPLKFHSFGIPSRATGAWPPQGNASRVLAVAPFVGAHGTTTVAALAGESAKRTLLARPEELDQIASAELDEWSEVLVLSDPASGESTEEARRPSGLHAKIVATEHRGQVVWYFGSANLTRAALTGRNVEVLVRLGGRRAQCGIEQFLCGFRPLCEPYERSMVDTEDEDAALAEVQRGKQALECAQRAIVQSVGSGCLHIVCNQREGDDWQWRLDGAVDGIPDGVTVQVWPASIEEAQSRSLDQQRSWPLPVVWLTAFVAFRLEVGVEEVDDLRFAMRLPASGLPSDRAARILRSFVDSPAKFMQFLRALLGGLEGQSILLPGDGEGNSSVAWEGALGEGTLLEDMLRAASRDPERLDVVRRLVVDLQRTEDSRTVVPPDLLELWQAIDQTVTTR